MSDTPLVSIIIRARNEAISLRRLLPILKNQRTDFAFEIWLLDNDSQDETAALAKEYGLSYHHIPRGAFNYSTALNQGAALARGEIIVCISAHCFPANDTWLAALVKPLRDDSNVIASYGRQWTDPRNSPFEAMGDAHFFPADTSEPAMVAFSNANSAIRKQFVLLHPFNPAIQILEDHLFYLELSGEYKIVYVPEALVHHEHATFSWKYYVRRWAREGWSFFFLKRHRGLNSPFVPRRIVTLRNFLINYPRQALGFARQGAMRLALLTVPFFWLRDLIWLAGYLRARLKQPAMSQADTALLLRMNRFMLRQITRGEASITLRAPLDWPEERQLKADWGFIRQNIADFIRRCHERGLISGPMLEVGASGQNDYLKEWYEMRTSNLETNLQGSEVALDMENMHMIADCSLGTVLCSEVIEHIFHPDRAVAEAFRVLRPGGTLIVTTPYQIVIHNSTDDGGFHGRNFTPQGLELVLREAGFEIVLVETRGETEILRKLMPSNVFAVGRKPQE